MWALARPLLRALRVPSATMVIGLDLTYDHAVYRAVVPRALRRAERVIAISEATAGVARGLGVASERIHVVLLGVDAPEVDRAARLEARNELAARLALRDGDVLVLTLGRLVKRKGVAWFLENVLPRLPTETVYIVAGAGPEEDRLREIVDRLALGRRVHLRGEVDEVERELLFRGADVFVQPNIEVPGDIEGFGLVTIEAAMRGLPVVAADLQGLADAVVDSVTGKLLPSADVDAWVDELYAVASDPAQLAALGSRYQAAARARYSERTMGEELIRALGR